MNYMMDKNSLNHCDVKSEKSAIFRTLYIRNPPHPPWASGCDVHYEL